MDPNVEVKLLWKQLQNALKNASSEATSTSKTFEMETSIFVPPLMQHAPKLVQQHMVLARMRVMLENT